MTFLSDPHPDYDRFGFDRVELERFLNLHGRTLTGQPMQKASDLAETNYPDWARDLIGIDSFTITDAAWLLCGIDPLVSNCPSDEEYRDQNAACRVLSSALNGGQIESVGDDDQGALTLNAEALRLWCPTVGRAWPIPPRPHLTARDQDLATDAALMEKLRQSEVRAVAAESKLKVMGELSDTTKNLREQIAGLQKDVATLEAEKAQAITDVQNLQSEIADGKGKSFMLRLIGGLAMAGAELDIHASRINGISDVVNTLAAKGVITSEETLRKRLKEAAELISQNRNPK